MPRITGPLFSQTASGTIAAAIIYTHRSNEAPRRAEITRASPRLRFRRPRPAKAPSIAQAKARDSLAAATAYAKAPPSPDVPAIESIMRARSLPFFHAASAYYMRPGGPTDGLAWDDGATSWDSGATTWPE